MLLAEDLLHTVIKKVWLLSLNNDNIEEVPPIFSHHVFHAFVSEKISEKNKKISTCMSAHAALKTEMSYRKGVVLISTTLTQS